MKAITKQSKECCTQTKAVAQCCSKASKLMAGCHD